MRNSTTVFRHECHDACVRASLAGFVLGFDLLSGTAALSAAETPATDAVSFDKQIRLIFQANCQGCHQPAKAGGQYVMTAFEGLVKGARAVRRQSFREAGSQFAHQSNHAERWQAEMPKGKAPLAPAEIELIKKWIAQGAKDDTAAGAKQRYDQDHPPNTHAACDHVARFFARRTNAGDLWLP